MRIDPRPGTKEWAYYNLCATTTTTSRAYYNLCSTVQPRTPSRSRSPVPHCVSTSSSQGTYSEDQTSEDTYAMSSTSSDTDSDDATYSDDDEGASGLRPHQQVWPKTEDHRLVSTTTARRTSTGEGLPAIINNDLSYVTAIYEDGTRKVARACQILHDLEKVGKDGRFSFHTNPPMVDTETHRTMTGRYNIDVAKQVFFLPKTIDLTQRNTEDKQVSVHEVGALFKGCFGQLPSVHASVVWDTQVLPGTNASSAVVKFKQAKLFLVRDVRVKEGKAVRIL